jgi:hypothetical protein
LNKAKLKKKENVAREITVKNSFILRMLLC